MHRSASSPRRSDRIWVIAIGLAVALGAAVRVWAALQWRMNFDSDEAIFALMARHLLQGQFSPLLYGTGHLGSLESILSAIPMSVFGQSVPVFRSSALVLMATFMMVQAIYVARHWGGRAAFLTSLFVALPGFHILEWSFQPIGAYGALLSCGLGVVLLSDRIPEHGRARIARLFLIGVLAGIGLWSNQMMVVFLAAALVPRFLGSSEWRHLSSMVNRLATRWVGRSFFRLAPLVPIAAGLLVVMSFFVSNCSPVWRFERIQWVARGGLALAGLGSLGLLLWQSERPGRRVLEACVSVAGLMAGFSPLGISWLSGNVRPANIVHRSCPTGILQRAELLVREILPASWGVPVLQAWSSLSLLQIIGWVIVLALVLSALVWFAWKHRHELIDAIAMKPISGSSDHVIVVTGVFALPLLLSLFANNTVDVYSVRHLLAAWWASAVIFGTYLDHVIRRRKWLGVVASVLWIGIVAAAMLWKVNGHWRVKFTEYTRSSVDALVTELSHRDVTAGYADYWGSYTLDYLTMEALKIVPYTGPDLYPSYARYARAQGRIAFIFPKDRAPRSGTGTVGMLRLLEMPNDVSGEGPAHQAITELVASASVVDEFEVGPWEIWIVAR